jgi:hypothetical protein
MVLLYRTAEGKSDEQSCLMNPKFHFIFTLCITCTCYVSMELFLLKLQAWQCMPDRAFSWNVLSLFTKSGMLFLEVSLIAFLLQGNDASGFESLARTFVISGAVVAADVLLKV